MTKLDRRQFLIVGCGYMLATLVGCGRRNGSDVEATGSLPTATSDPYEKWSGSGFPAQDGIKTGCPFNLLDDPYPGRCQRYVDKNGDGLCDLSKAV